MAPSWWRWRWGAERLVEQPVNLFDWFHDRVRAAHAEVGADLSSDGELYLSRLLAERARTDREVPAEETLAELHARGASSSPAEAARTYRELGDRALYVVGYFEESLSRKVVGAAYYTDMGSAAYARVDDVFRRFFASAFGGLYRELAERFVVCVEVVREVRRSVDGEPDLLMRLLLEWRRTGSEESARRLRAAGIVVPRGPAVDS